MDKFFLHFPVPPLEPPLNYRDKLLLVGSCFTEHMASRLEAHQFTTLQNPHGILFNPLSVADSLRSYAAGKSYTEHDLFFANELWSSWAHHSRFSHVDKATALAGINASQKEAAAFLRESTCVIITLGSAFQYYLRDGDRPVANNHRMPAQLFEKRLLSTEMIISELEDAMAACRTAAPGLRFLLTISPVRHIRDGVVENNRSKARLIEAVQSLCERLSYADYFPAYELVIDVLRDYRFYDVDGVHPNYAATSHVWEEFVKACIDPAVWPLMKELGALTTSAAHRPRFPETDSHKSFCSKQLEKTRALQERFPYIDLREIAAAFRTGASPEAL